MIYDIVPEIQNNPDQNRRYFAGFGRRLLAGCIDLIIIFLVDWTLSYYLGLMEGFRMLQMMIRHEPVKTTDGVLINSLIPGPVASLIIITIIIIPWIYFAFLESSKNQATLGKIIARIVVTDMHGSRITFARATIRHFSKFLSFILLFTGFFSIIFTKYSQGLHDMIAACLVYYRPEKIE
jgi:uncharacterized RDD family membrane protein YckC